MTTLALPEGVIYLVLVAISALGIDVPFEADYLQEGVPAAIVTVAAEPSSSGATEDVFRLTATLIGAESDGPVVYRAERSSVAAHNYLVYHDEGYGPFVLSVAGALRALSVPLDTPVVEVSVEGAATADESATGEPASAFYLIRRDGHDLLSVPESGIVLRYSHTR